MKKSSFFIIAFVFYLLSSCIIPSLHPTVGEGNRITEDRLLGEWQSDEAAIWKFERAADLKLTYKELPDY